MSSDIETLEYHFAGVGGIVCLIIAVFFILVGLQIKKAMLGRHLAAVGGIRCLIKVFSDGRATEKEMLECHLVVVGGISCLIVVVCVGRATEKESHAWTPSVGRRWNQLV